MGRARTLIAVLLLTPLIASAQSAHDAKDDSVPQTESVPPQAGSDTPQSEVGAPEKPVTSAETETNAETDKRGFTVEASVGVSVLLERSSPYVYEQSDPIPGLALAFGVGYFVSPGAAVGLRATDFSWGTTNVGFVGAHAQFWLRPSVWLGTGIGAGFITDWGGVYRFGGFPSIDARLGYALGRGLDVSLEIARVGVLGPFSDGYLFGEPSYLVNVALGYQRL
ncbi:MAG: hypothetical protein HOV81_20950 [Kofleriaceae bacterium]|nr:hypothetical protein [Kofleriaceae bacterium]